MSGSTGWMDISRACRRCGRSRHSRRRSSEMDSTMTELKVETADREITMSRAFDAPRDLVFEAFTQNVHLKAWWGPREWPIGESRLDFRVGGTWHFSLRGSDGTEARDRQTVV